MAPLAGLGSGLVGVLVFLVLALVPVAVLDLFLRILRAAARRAGPWGDSDGPSSSGRSEESPYVPCWRSVHAPRRRGTMS